MRARSNGRAAPVSRRSASRELPRPRRPPPAGRGSAPRAPAARPAPRGPARARASAARPRRRHGGRSAPRPRPDPDIACRTMNGWPTPAGATTGGRRAAVAVSSGTPAREVEHREAPVGDGIRAGPRTTGRAASCTSAASAPALRVVATHGGEPRQRRAVQRRGVGAARRRAASDRPSAASVAASSRPDTTPGHRHALEHHGQRVDARRVARAPAAARRSSASRARDRPPAPAPTAAHSRRRGSVEVVRARRARPRRSALAASGRPSSSAPTPCTSAAEEAAVRVVVQRQLPAPVAGPHDPVVVAAVRRGEPTVEDHLERPRDRAARSRPRRP